MCRCPAPPQDPASKRSARLSPLHSANLLAGNGGDHLRRVGDVLVKLEPSAMFQRFQIQLEQNVGIQHTIPHTFQQHDGIIVKIVFFELQVIIFSAV